MNKSVKNKKQFTIITIIFSIISLIFINTIAYSAFSSTMNITGMAHARVEADVRITDFLVSEVSNSVVTSYEEFSKDSISSNIKLPTATSYVIYKVEVTNYGSTNVGILNITGIPSNLSYELIDYKLKDKICDENNKCNNLAKKIFNIKITGVSGEYDLNLHFEFKPFYKITYTNLTNNNYPSEIFSNETLNINIGNDNAPGVLVSSGGTNTDNYSYKNGILKVPSVTNNIEVKGFSIIENFNYTGGEQTYQILYPGTYQLETWGAEGGANLNLSKYPDSHSGYGAYSTGTIKLSSEQLYVNVGGEGRNASKIGGYNGGGDSIVSGMTGGGATHIATISGLLSSLEQYKDTGEILIVSGGGGGSDVYNGGSGGGYKGVTAYYEGNSLPGEGGTQTDGGFGYTNGSFGKGGTSGNNNGDGSGAGGGGYYGGGSGQKIEWSSGGGGSGYIGNSLLTNKHMTCYECETSNDESTKTLTTTNVSTSAKSDYAKSGNGYAKITLVSMTKRLDEDIEITDYSVYETTNATSLNNLFTPTTISSNITLSSNTSTITYKVDVTNFGTTPMGIFRITGLPSGLTYELINYSLKTKICNENGSCNQDATKTFYIKITGAQGTYDLNLSFEFKPFYTISYTNITNNNYQNEIFYNDTLNINIGNSTPGILILSNGSNIDNYSYKDGILEVPNIINNIEVKGFSYTENFDHIENEQVYQIPYDGIYKIETWGASGGGSKYSIGGYGGYATGEIYINKNKKLYINVGGLGAGDSYTPTGGYNGGGNGKIGQHDQSGGGGGGATHIATISGTLSSLEQYKNTGEIIIVSGGGGGAGSYLEAEIEDQTKNTCIGGAAGGFIGNNGYTANTLASVGSGGSQTKAGQSKNYDESTKGKFGQGGQGGVNLNTAGGGGGGYYGGGGGYCAGGGGGSSYIGNPLLNNKHMTCYECETSDDESTKTITTTNVSETPTADYAKSGNGYAKITLLKMEKE